jgi:tetratricopeptide (TPR) repeat protein
MRRPIRQPAPSLPSAFSVPAARRLAGAALALALAGCAGEEPPTPEPGRAVVDVVPRAEPADFPAGFDEAQSTALLAEATAAEERGDDEAARRLYEQAALLWPDHIAAWRGLARLAEDPERRRAAAFVAERVALYPSDALFVQREVSRVLDIYVQEQAALEDANAAKLAYATRLANFYRSLYSDRGEYEPPSPIWDF